MTIPGLILTGPGRFGDRATGIGDINADGLDDLLITAPQEPDPTVTPTVLGTAYVIFGTDAEEPRVIDIGTLTQDQGFRIVGTGQNSVPEVGQLRHLMDMGVAGGFDLNADGIDDFAIGAPLFDDGDTDTGGAYVVFGRSSGFGAEIDVSALSGSDGFHFASRGADDRFHWLGYSIAAPGDVDGDGRDDLVIGAPGQPLTTTVTLMNARGYVLRGQSAGFAFDAEYDSDALPVGFAWTMAPEQMGRDIGRSLAAAGDIDGDGLDDFIVGAPYNRLDDPVYSGRAWVVFGQSGGWSADIDLDDLDGTNGFRIDGAAESDYLGASVAGVGDVDGDGFDDLVIGAFGVDDAVTTDAGAVYLVYGGSSGFTASFDVGDIGAAAAPRATVLAEPAGATGSYAWLGWAAAGGNMAAGRDVNGDGLDDFIVTARGPSGEPMTSYLVFGRSGGFAADFDLSTLDGSDGYILTGPDSGGRGAGAGYEAAWAGDVNDDGIPDFVLTNVDIGGGSSANTAYLIYGGADNLAALAATTDARYGTGTGMIDPTTLCFAAGTLIATPAGPRPVETLRSGDMVLTADRGPRPLRWTGAQSVGTAEQIARPRRRPVLIGAGALGAGLPRRELRVSPQHRLLIGGRLVAAVRLIGRPGIRRDDACRPVAWYHLLFDRHEILWAEGAPAESLLPGPQALAALTPAQRAEILRACPALLSGPVAPARPLADAPPWLLPA